MRCGERAAARARAGPCGGVGRAAGQAGRPERGKGKREERVGPASWAVGFLGRVGFLFIWVFSFLVLIFSISNSNSRQMNSNLNLNSHKHSTNKTMLQHECNNQKSNL